MLDEGDGPFYLFFQASYDQEIEGALAVAVYQYD